jgi:hypothetical protein
LSDSKDLGNQRREKGVITTSRKAVEDDEGEPEGAGTTTVSGKDTGEPECENTGSSKEQREDEGVLPSEFITGVARRDARHGVDGVACGKEIGTRRGAETEDDGIGRNEGERQLGTCCLEKGSNGREEEGRLQGQSPGDVCVGHFPTSAPIFLLFFRGASRHGRRKATSRYRPSCRKTG